MIEVVASPERPQHGRRPSEKGQQWYLEGEIPDDLQDVLSPGYYWAWKNENGTFDLCTNTEGHPVHLPASDIPEQLSRLRQERTERTKEEHDDIFLMPPTPSRPSSAVSAPSRAPRDWISGSQVKSVRLLKQLKPELRVASHLVSPLTARQRVAKEIAIPSTTTGRPIISPRRYKPPMAPVPPDWDPTSSASGAGIPAYDALYDYDCHHFYPGTLKSLRKQRDLSQEHHFVLRERIEQFMERFNCPLPPRSAGSVDEGIEWYNSPLYHIAVLRRDSGNDGEDASPPTFYEERYTDIIMAIKQAGVRAERPLSVEEGDAMAKAALVEIMAELRMRAPRGVHEESSCGQEYSECFNELWRLLHDPPSASTYYSLLATIKELLMYRRKTLEIIGHMLRFDDEFHEFAERSCAWLLADPRVAITVKKITQWAERANTIRSLFYSWMYRYARFAFVGASPHGTFMWKQKELLRYVEDAVHKVQQSDEARGDEGVGCGPIIAHIFRSTYFNLDDPLTMGPTPTWYAPGVSDLVRQKMKSARSVRGRFRQKSQTSEGNAKLPWAGRR